MSEQMVLKIFEDVGAILKGGHFVYTSGKHGSVYVNKDAIYPFNRKTSFLGSLIAKNFFDDDIQTVIGPEKGAIILSQSVGYHLSQALFVDVFSVYAEKDGNGGFEIRRGYDRFVEEKNVLVVEDILNTGGSVKKTIKAVRKIGGNVVGVGCLWNRGGITSESIDVPKLISLTNLKFDAWNEKECPLCEKGIPISTEVGKGEEFLVRNAVLSRLGS